MVKRLVFVLLVLFVLSLLFVQVSEAATQQTPVTYEVTVDQIGFYAAQNSIPDSIVTLPTPVIIHEELNGSGNPNISDFVYLGNIPNGSFLGIGMHITSITPTMQGVTPPLWFPIGFDNGQTPVTHAFIDSDRKLITIIDGSPAPHATVTDL